MARVFQFKCTMDFDKPPALTVQPTHGGLLCLDDRVRSAQYLLVPTKFATPFPARTFVQQRVWAWRRRREGEMELQRKGPRPRTEAERRAAIEARGEVAARMLESGHVPVIALDRIEVAPDRLRKLQPDKVAEFAESMTVNGLAQPIVVRPVRDGYELVAGWHRLEAARQLGWSSISAVVRRINADQAGLVEIDENLFRAELTPAERARHVGLRKKLYEKLHPETKHGAIGRGREKSRQNGDSKERFTKETAERTGQSERTIQRDAARADKVVVLDDVRGTSLDKGAELDALARLPEDEQRRLAECARAGEDVSARARVEPPDDALRAFDAGIGILKPLVTESGFQFTGSAFDNDDLKNIARLIVSVMAARRVP